VTKKGSPTSRIDRVKFEVGQEVGIASRRDSDKKTKKKINKS